MRRSFSGNNVLRKQKKFWFSAFYIFDPTAVEILEVFNASACQLLTHFDDRPIHLCTASSIFRHREHGVKNNDNDSNTA